MEANHESKPQNNMKNDKMESERNRIKAHFQYLCALQRGDFATISRILEMAESDAILEEMIVRGHLDDEMEAEAQEAELSEARLLTIMEKTFGQTYKETDFPVTDSAPQVQPVLTIGEVATRVVADAMAPFTPQSERLAEHELQTARDLQNNVTPVPPQMGQRSFSDLFARLGVQISDHLASLIRQTTIFMNMSRSGGLANMSATRIKSQWPPAATQTEEDSTEPAAPEAEAPEK